MLLRNILQYAKKIIKKTPLNRNYITDSYLEKRIKETVSFVKGDVLDVGCGDKPYKEFFCSNVHSYVGMDLPFVHLYYSMKGQADVYGHARNLPFKSQSFDTILCTEVLPHIHEPHRAFEEFARVLKCSGILIVTANKSWEKRTGLPVPDLWRFTDEGLAYLARQHELDVIYTKQGCGFFATLGQLIARFLNKEVIYRKAITKGIDREPHVLIAVFILPLIAVFQGFFLILEKLYSSKLDTLFYILVAKKVVNKRSDENEDIKPFTSSGTVC